MFVDVEHALDPSYAKAVGVNIDDLFVSQPGSGEEALEITDTFVSRAYDTCAWAMHFLVNFRQRRALSILHLGMFVPVCLPRVVQSSLLSSN